MAARIPLPPKSGRTTLMQSRRKLGVIGNEGSGLPCYEYTYYFEYTNPEVPANDRYFEVRVRMTLKTWRDPHIAERKAREIAEAKMEESVNIALESYAKKSKGYRQVGFSKARKPRFIIINKKTQWNSGWQSEITMKELHRRILVALAD